MGIKKIVMLATLLTAISGGEISAMAKTRQISKFTHVKVSKHTVSGKTTKYAHVKLIHLKHGEKVAAKADKHGKFVIKVKQNNLTKLKFKLKATKHGFKGRTYSHVVKTTKPIKQAAENGTITEKNTLKPESVVAPQTVAGNNTISNSIISSNVTPSSPVLPTTPSKSKEQLIREKKSQLEIAKNAYAKMAIALDPTLSGLPVGEYDDEFIFGYQANVERARLELYRKISNGNKEEIAIAQKNLDLAKSKYEQYLPTYIATNKKFRTMREKIRPLGEQVEKLAKELQALQPDAPYESTDYDF
ncbi:hypothetical protein FC99_GL001172 [Levilactobacillus koreensis JCM 16448]|uniref:Bacterial Ig domain-containing protein n=1 Tax=Levilactobacillus koreensis TaxID=637971 RepID=A0AAC8ZG52_9LACO|nr:hypothetical protein [Levilactobacillus koreensis]AKP64153.1 hypothetical protein ABN16_03495 [Levilactobacillus koreensis]KRK86927.1 hypothetical protein FC99_GL001172 [Levilactobacillus koreensis JCM 16448]